MKNASARKAKPLFLLATFLIGAGGILAAHLLAQSQPGRTTGWLFCCIPALQAALGLLVFPKAAETPPATKEKKRGRAQAEEKGAQPGKPALLPDLGAVFYSGGVTAAAVLLGFALRLLADRVASLAGVTLLRIPDYTNGVPIAAIVSLLFFPLFSELFHRYCVERLLGGRESLADALWAAAFYALAFPAPGDLLSLFLLGAALARIRQTTGSRFLAYAASLAGAFFRLAYAYLPQFGPQGGSGVSTPACVGILLLFLAVSGAVFALSECLFHRYKPKGVEWLTGGVVFLLLAVAGAALTAGN